MTTSLYPSPAGLRDLLGMAREVARPVDEHHGDSRDPQHRSLDEVEVRHDGCGGDLPGAVVGYSPPQGLVEAFSMAWRIMIIGMLPPVLLKTQVMRIETGSMNIRNTQKGVRL